MNASELDIANLALAHIGEEPISAFTERSNQAAKANQYYRFAVAEALEAYDWPEARAFRTLTAVSGITLPSSWEYVYALPSDCVAPRFQIGPEGHPDPRYRLRFVRYTNPDTGARYLGSNLPDAILVYTTDTISPEAYSPSLINAISWNLAIKLAMPITRTRARLIDAQQGYALALSAAKTNAANSEPTYANEYDAPWIEERVGAAPNIGRIDRG